MILIFLLLLVIKTLRINASLGESNQNYSSCLDLCFREQCNSEATSFNKSNQEQFFYMKLLGWTCHEEVDL